MLHLHGPSNFTVIFTVKASALAGAKNALGSRHGYSSTLIINYRQGAIILFQVPVYAKNSSLQQTWLFLN
jgi:hypothetical protein